MTPCLLMAMVRISGNFGSVVCWREGERERERERERRERDGKKKIRLLSHCTDIYLTFTSKKAEPKVGHFEMYFRNPILQSAAFRL